MSGFYEWEKEGAQKRPYPIYLQDKSIMNVAGIWDTWHAGTPDERRSFSILTTSANELMSMIHDRMPVILGAPDLEEGLDPEIHEKDALKKLVKPCPSTRLAANPFAKGRGWDIKEWRAG